jgi:hypothetical protein
MNEDMNELIQLCILDLLRRVKPEYDSGRTYSAVNPDGEDPLGWLYLANTAHVIRERMTDSKIEMDLFDDIYFAICWEVRERFIETEFSQCAGLE